MINEKKRLSINAFIYLFSAVLSSGVSFLLIPVFTRLLSAADFGIISIATTTTSLLTQVLGFGLSNYVTQMHFKYTQNNDQAKILGSLLAFWFVASTGLALVVEAVGELGYMDIVRGVRFKPYLELALWTAYMTIFISAIQALFMARKQSVKMALVSLSVSLIGSSLSLLLITWLREGAKGCLVGALIASVIVGGGAIILLVKKSQIGFERQKVVEGLKFSLPLIPHTVALWVLTLSDRYILSHFESTGAVGIYSLGYQVGYIMSMVTNSVNNSFYPIASLKLSEGDGSRVVPHLGTSVIAGFAITSVGVAALGPELILMFTPERYHGAVAIVPWIALAFFFQGLYFLLSLGTWFSMKTGLMPIITIIAAVANVAINFYVIPRMGVVGAGVAAALSYGLLALLNWALACYTFRIAWEFRKWGAIVAIGVSCYVSCRVLGFTSTPVRIASKLGVLTVVFPSVLVFTKIVDLTLLQSLWRVFRQRILVTTGI